MRLPYISPEVEGEPGMTGADDSVSIVRFGVFTAALFLRSSRNVCYIF